MKPSISRKMDMVKEVFLSNRRLRESIAFGDFIDNHYASYEEDYPQLQLLIEGNSKKKVSFSFISSLKTNGIFINDLSSFATGD